MELDTDQAEWDTRYGPGDGTMWSGEPNGALVTEIRALDRGSVLDIGCGEGADTIWLAQQGFTATGLDVSAVAIQRAQAAASRSGVDVQFAAVDVIADPPAFDAYDLVVVSYPALKTTSKASTASSIVQAVAPGGRFFLVMHAHNQETAVVVRSMGFDPDGYVGIDDFKAALADGFDIEVDDERARLGVAPDALHQRDRVLVAKRRH